MDSELFDVIEFTASEQWRKTKPTSGSVVTNSGLGNIKDGEYGMIAVTFVVIDGTHYYIRRMSGRQGMEDDRREHLEQIRYALKVDEMEYYTPLDEYEFRQHMKDYSMMEHEKPPVKRMKAKRYGEFEMAFEEAQQPYVRDVPKLGRNDKCFCGSGKKYKKCHGA